MTQGFGKAAAVVFKLVGCFHGLVSGAKLSGPKGVGAAGGGSAATDLAAQCAVAGRNQGAGQGREYHSASRFSVQPRKLLRLNCAKASGTRLRNLDKKKKYSRKGPIEAAAPRHYFPRKGRVSAGRIQAVIATARLEGRGHR